MRTGTKLANDFVCLGIHFFFMVKQTSVLHQSWFTFYCKQQSLVRAWECVVKKKNTLWQETASFVKKVLPEKLMPITKNVLHGRSEHVLVAQQFCFHIFCRFFYVNEVYLKINNLVVWVKFTPFLVWYFCFFPLEFLFS